MTYPYYTVEFTVEVGTDLASTPQEAAEVALTQLAERAADCRVIDPTVDESRSDDLAVTDVDLLPDVGTIEASPAMA